MHQAGGTSECNRRVDGRVFLQGGAPTQANAGLWHSLDDIFLSSCTSGTFGGGATPIAPSTALATQP
eukprot:356262-Chlamydomonas_euryale.AAC.2